jgi:hypothetical protein
MIQYLNLVPECNVDTVFVEALGYKKPNHASDIANVSLILEKMNKKGKAIGFIDDDKKKTIYIREFKVLEKINSVQLFKHPLKEQYLVVVHPAMDKFIFDLHTSLGIKMPKRLPKDFEAFLSVTKTKAIKNNSDFRNLVNTIVQRRPDEIVKVKEWISKYSGY